MKVSELIQHLQKCSPDAVVYLEDWNEEYCDPEPVGCVLTTKTPSGERVLLDVARTVTTFRPTSPTPVEE